MEPTRRLKTDARSSSGVSGSGDVSFWPSGGRGPEARGEGVVAGIADGARRAHDAGLLKPLPAGERGLLSHRRMPEAGRRPPFAAGAVCQDLSPSSLPTLEKASSALSRSSLVCAAVTMVRTRPLPSGTVG